MKDAISLGVGEPDFDTPWHIRDEGIYSLEKGRTFYTSNAGLKELKIEIDKYLKRRFGVSYDYNNEIMVTVGGSEAIDIAMRAMLDPGDEVLIPHTLLHRIKYFFTFVVIISRSLYITHPSLVALKIFVHPHSAEHGHFPR